MAADAAIWDYTTEITLEESGGSITEGSFVQANDATLTAANKADRTHIDMRLTTIGFGTNPSVGGVLNLIERVINLEGTEDAPPPSTNYPHKTVATFKVDDDEGLTQALLEEIEMAYPDEDSEFYIEGAAGQTVDSGWNLRATCKSLFPSAS